MGKENVFPNGAREQKAHVKGSEAGISRADGRLQQGAVHEVAKDRQAGEQREVFEERLRHARQRRCGEEEDLVQVWGEYTEWAAAQGSSGEEAVLLGRACGELAADKGYCSDRRHLKLWVRYADRGNDPKGIFEFAESQGIGITYALLYEGWATALERQRLYQEAGAVYRLGVERSAEPVERLKQRFADFEDRMRRRAARAAKAASSAGSSTGDTSALEIAALSAQYLASSDALREKQPAPGTQEGPTLPPPKAASRDHPAGRCGSSGAAKGANEGATDENDKSEKALECGNEHRQSSTSRHGQRPRVEHDDISFEELRARRALERQAAGERPDATHMQALRDAQEAVGFSVRRPSVEGGGGIARRSSGRASAASSLALGEATATQEITTSGVRALLDRRTSRRSFASTASRLSSSSSIFQEPTFTMEHEKQEVLDILAHDPQNRFDDYGDEDESEDLGGGIGEALGFAEDRPFGGGQIAGSGLFQVFEEDDLPDAAAPPSGSSHGREAGGGAIPSGVLRVRKD